MFAVWTSERFFRLSTSCCDEIEEMDFDEDEKKRFGKID